jgi:hypothetical protein
MSLVAKIKYRLKAGWGFMKIVRVLIALVIVHESAETRDGILALLGSLLLVHALLNQSCCATGFSDSGSLNSSPNESSGDITFEEVK